MNEVSKLRDPIRRSRTGLKKRIEIVAKALY